LQFSVLLAYELAVQTYRFTISKNDSGQRLDLCIVGQDVPLTRSMAKQLIDDGLITVNGKQSKASYHVRENDSVDISIPEPEEAKAEPEDIPLNILYEDGDIIVINKSVDMVVHPAVGNPKGTLVNALLGHCRDLSGIGGELKPGIVHRLDKGTSGAMVVAKNDEAHLDLSKQFKDREVTKIYRALVYGAPKDSGKVDKPIGRSPSDRKKMSTQAKQGRIAYTEWKVLERFGKYLSWLEINLGTGRTHQIRVHMTDMGHPLVGDAQYGRGGPHRVPEGPMRDVLEGFDRPALHAWKLGFVHPRTQKQVQFEAPLPDDLNELLEKLRIL
jgi:23S rRNA pseudouridine1911/1915/1917 synthase